MKNIGIFINTSKKVCIESAEKLIKKFKDSGLNCEILNDNFCLDNIEAVITLGGDGTVLKVASFCAEKNLPILAINMGRVGFLTNFELKDVDEIIDRLKSNDFSKINRAMLSVEISGKNYLALNDISIRRNESLDGFGQILHLDISVNGTFFDTYMVDGVIVATPTGSTAYSLSAGGAVLTPDVKAIALTPVCPYTFFSKPMVFSADNKIAIKIAREDSNGVIVADGKVVANIKKDDEIYITTSSLSATFLLKEEENFYKRLINKLTVFGKR